MIDGCLQLVDGGLFTELAVRLARDWRSVRCHVPWASPCPTINDRAVGAGLPNVEWIEDPFRDEIFESTDVYMFPDIFRAGTQQLLERAGKPVWGSRTGDELETRRIWFRHLQENLGLPVPDYAVVTGLTELEEYLRENDRECFIKTTSKIRGSFETHHFFSFDQERYWFLCKRVCLGAASEHVEFIIEQPIESDFESGLDTFCVDGNFPKTPMQGIEIKDKLILSSAQTESRTPKPFEQALVSLSGELKARRYRNFITAEFRQNILTDISCRAPDPGIGVEMEMIANLGEIINAGARGELIEPDYIAEFGIQAAVFHCHEEEMWKQFPVPEDMRQWFKLIDFCRVDGLYQIVPRPTHGEKIGWLLGIGDTIEEAAEHLFENKAKLKDYPFDVSTDSLEDAIAQAEAMHQQGLEFSDQEIPEPEAVMKNEREPAAK